jgi:ABC-type transport system involved in multi-copper enzyme maturation permease subunit
MLLFLVIFLILLPLVLLAIGILLILIISPQELVLVVFLEIAIHPFIVLSLIFLILPILLSEISKPLLSPILPFQTLLLFLFLLVKINYTFYKNRSYWALLSESLRMSQAPLTRLNFSSELEDTSGCSCFARM